MDIVIVLAGAGKTAGEPARKQPGRVAACHPRWLITAGSRGLHVRRQRTGRLRGSRTGSRGSRRQPDWVLGEGLASGGFVTRTIGVLAMLHYLA